jgi:hypothetical protein
VERTQISLSAAQAHELRRIARKRNTSMAALIREAVDRTYGLEPGLDARWERALASIGGFNSGFADISERHDDYLVDAYDK